jgi:hypothetical protein
VSVSPSIFLKYSMIKIDQTLNEFEVMVVADHLRENGVEHYTLARGNDCIWAYYGHINEYYIFREGKLVDIQID